MSQLSTIAHLLFSFISVAFCKDLVMGSDTYQVGNHDLLPGNVYVYSNNEAIRVYSGSTPPLKIIKKAQILNSENKLEACLFMPEKGQYILVQSDYVTDDSHLKHQELKEVLSSSSSIEETTKRGSSYVIPNIPEPMDITKRDRVNLPYSISKLHRQPDFLKERHVQVGDMRYIILNNLGIGKSGSTSIFESDDGKKMRFAGKEYNKKVDDVEFWTEVENLLRLEMLIGFYWTSEKNTAPPPKPRNYPPMLAHMALVAPQEVPKRIFHDRVIIMKLVEGKSLYNILNNIRYFKDKAKHDGNQEEVQKLTIREETLFNKYVETIQNFHRKFLMVHGDVAPRNVMFDEDTKVMALIDFGRSRHASSQQEFARELETAKRNWIQNEE